MEEENKQLLNDERDKEAVKSKPQTEEEEEEEAKSKAPKKASGGGDGGGGGGWGFSTLSVFSDLQKATEEISHNVQN